MTPPTPSHAHAAFVAHPRYKYRGCAPDPVLPSRAGGDLDLPIDAWAPYTGDGAEPQRTRHAREQAAIEVCLNCPVMVQCLTYANTTHTDAVTGAERLTEPEGIWGGQLALERHRALISRRTTAAATDRTLAEARSPQKQAVLAALAVELYDTRVAARAGMDLRTANWHRSALCSLLGLDKETASRDDLLAAALHHQLLPPGTRIVWDGLWHSPAAPTTDGIRQRRIAPHIPAVLFTPRPKQPRRKRRTAATGPAGTTGAPAVPGGRRRMRLVPTPPDTLPAPHPAARLETAA